VLVDQPSIYRTMPFNELTSLVDGCFESKVLITPESFRPEAGFYANVAKYPLAVGTIAELAAF
jgi:hypothetical protein